MSLRSLRWLLGVSGVHALMPINARGHREAMVARKTRP
jgi:hypothetical protein